MILVDYVLAELALVWDEVKSLFAQLKGRWFG
jgi:hypothetical protein